jgi:hypothetical protein
MLASPNHVVVGAVDPDRVAGFVQLFGFERAAEAVLPAEAARALYGLDGETRERVLSVPGAERGWLRIVRTTEPPRPGGPFDHRPLAIDLYSRDIRESLEIARTYDIRCGELVEYTMGPYEIKEFVAFGPERLTLVLIQANILRPCVLKTDPDRLHSELNSLVWTVASAAEALPAWRERAGLEVLVDAHFGGPIVSRLMGLSQPEVPVRLAVLSDTAQNPSRFEFIEFCEEQGRDTPNFPLAAGLFAAGFSVDDLDAARLAMTDCTFSEPVAIDTPLHRGARAVGAVAPGGVRFELWQENGEPGS